MELAFVRAKPGYKPETEMTGKSSSEPYSPQNLEITDIEGFLHATMPDFDDRVAAALDRRLANLEELGQTHRPKNPLSFSRTVLDGGTVCGLLNEFRRKRSYQDL
jgi:hypothetical protein